MHPTILVQRRAKALSRLTERSSKVIDKMGLDPNLNMRIQAVGIRNTDIADLTRIEAVADLMDFIAKDYGIEDSPPIENQINEFIAPPVVQEQEMLEAAEVTRATRSPQEESPSEDTSKKRTAAKAPAKNKKPLRK